MSRPIDYFFTPQSPWAYLGHARFVDLLRASRRAVRVLPVDYGRIFPLSGGLPLGQRAPQRQAYRLAELRRFAAHLNIALHAEPRHFPVDGAPAARLITAVAQADGPDAALRLAGAVMAACWAEQVVHHGQLQQLADIGLILYGRHFGDGLIQGLGERLQKVRPLNRASGTGGRRRE